MRSTLTLLLVAASLASCQRATQIPDIPGAVPDPSQTANGSDCPDNDSAAALRAAMRVHAVGPHGYLLHAGRAIIASLYSIDRADDIVIAFAPSVGCLHGRISVRARVLGSTPTEVSVENYTVVNDKELTVTMADDRVLLRDEPQRKLLSSIGDLQRATTVYRTLLESTVGVGLDSLYESSTVTGWYDEGSLPTSFTAKPTAAQVEGALAAIRLAFGDEAGRRLKALRDALAETQSEVQSLFLSSDLVSQLANEDLRFVQSEALSLSGRLTDLHARLDPLLAGDAATLDACAPRFITYVARKDLAGKDSRGGDVTVVSGTYFRADRGTPARVVFPPELDGVTLDVAHRADLSELKAADQDYECYQRLLPELLNRVGKQLATAQLLEKGLASGDREDENAIVALIEGMKQRVRDGVHRQLERDIRDARVRLSSLALSHGDRVEVIVRLTRQGTAVRPGESADAADLEERVVVRAVDYGVSFSTSPQFVLIKRASDVRTATAAEKPSNFEPAPGAMFSARLHILDRVGDWLIPSVGLAAHIPDFDPRNSLEIGLGPGIGLLDDHLHAGLAWDLSVPDHRQYWWISLDFLRTEKTFSHLFGGQQ